MKNLVGGLHTVYTKLKRLNITPLVCNVEQVRTLRALGAIQPGVNRCKLITKRDFETLYHDCTTSNARPGRPPKRFSSNMEGNLSGSPSPPSVFSNSLLSHSGAVQQAASPKVEASAQCSSSSVPACQVTVQQAQAQAQAQALDGGKGQTNFELCVQLLKCFDNDLLTSSQAQNSPAALLANLKNLGQAQAQSPRNLAVQSRRALQQLVQSQQSGGGHPGNQAYLSQLQQHFLQTQLQNSLRMQAQASASAGANANVNANQQVRMEAAAPAPAQVEAAGNQPGPEEQVLGEDSLSKLNALSALISHNANLNPVLSNFINSQRKRLLIENGQGEAEEAGISRVAEKLLREFLSPFQLS